MARKYLRTPASSAATGIVSKRVGSRYVSGHTDTWIKVKNPAAPAVKRERKRMVAVTLGTAISPD